MLSKNTALRPDVVKIAYSVREESGKTFWTRIGKAFVRADGSVCLDLVCPVGYGRLELRNERPVHQKAGCR